MKLFPSFFLIVSLLSGANLVRAQHGHLEAGASSTSAGSALQFVNRDHFDSTSGFVQPLVWATEGPYAGFYHGNITMTVRAATAQRGGPEALHPALGSEVSVELVSVSGPPGGVFGFWETGASEPTFSVGTGDEGGARWLLSENEGESGTDPYGHIHGRRLTASSPGIYTVTLRLHDESHNGPDEGPLHESSDPLAIQFIAGDGIPITVRQQGDFVLTVALHNDSLTVAAREDDGHTDHVHDALDLAKTLFAVSPHYRGYGDGHSGNLVGKGQAVWRLPAAHEGGTTAEKGDSQHEHTGAMDGEHDHASTLEWDGGDRPILNLEAVEDPNGGFNIYLDLSGFEFSPRNASKQHISGEGHAHIYVDGEKIGRVYNQAYYLGALAEGPHHVRVTLNANSHEDYTFEGELIESSVEIVVGPTGDGGGHHGHHTGENSREWDGLMLPELALEVVPDPASGWNLHFGYEHFSLNPRQASRAHQAGEGHAHIYLNGSKLTRLYGNAFHIPSLPEGDVEISVSLSANDHLEYTVDGEPLQVVQHIEQAHADAEHNGGRVSLTWDTSALRADDEMHGGLWVSIEELRGPGAVAVTKEISNHQAHALTREILASSHDGLNESDRFDLLQETPDQLAWNFSHPGDYTIQLSLRLESSSGEPFEQSFALGFRVMPSSSVHLVRVDEDLFLNWDDDREILAAASVEGPFHEVQTEGNTLRIDSTEGMRFFRISSESEGTHHAE